MKKYKAYYWNATLVGWRHTQPTFLGEYAAPCEPMALYEAIQDFSIYVMGAEDYTPVTLEKYNDDYIVLDEDNNVFVHTIFLENYLIFVEKYKK